MTLATVARISIASLSGMGCMGHRANTGLAVGRNPRHPVIAWGV